MSGPNGKKNYERSAKECSGCGRTRPLSQADPPLCSTCFRRKREAEGYKRPAKECSGCGRIRRLHQADPPLCNTCYKRPIINCKLCEKKAQHGGHGYCKPCWEDPVVVEHRRKSERMRKDAEEIGRLKKLVKDLREELRLANLKIEELEALIQEAKEQLYA